MIGTYPAITTNIVIVIDNTEIAMKIYNIGSLFPRTRKSSVHHFNSKCLLYIQLYPDSFPRPSSQKYFS